MPRALRRLAAAGFPQFFQLSSCSRPRRNLVAGHASRDAAGERPSPAPSPSRRRRLSCLRGRRRTAPTIQPTVAEPPAAQPTAPPAIERPPRRTERVGPRTGPQPTTLSRENARRAHAAGWRRRSSSGRRRRGTGPVSSRARSFSARKPVTSSRRNSSTRPRIARRPRSAEPIGSRLHPALRRRQPDPRRPRPAPRSSAPPTPPPAEPARLSETERIRDLVRRYERPSQLDADAYAYLSGADAQKIKARSIG
jgi:hypothetical protein